MGAAQRCVICDAQVNDLQRTCASVNCRLEYLRWLELKRPVCAVCGKPMQAGEIGKCCRNFVCNHRFVGLSEQLRLEQVGYCRYCQVLTSHREPNAESLQWNCLGVCCLILRANERDKIKRLVEREHKQQLQQAATLWKAELLNEREAIPSVLESVGGNAAEAESYQVVVVPFLNATVEVPAPERIQAFKNRVEVLINAAFTQTEQLSDTPVALESLPALASASESPVFAAACGTCRGKCCTQGEGHAFLSISTIRRVMRATPTATAAEILATYSSYLPERSVVGSCEFHTDRGCNLPHAMRADMCNYYICPALHEMRSSMEQDKPPGFFIAAADRKLENSRFCTVAPPS